MVNRIKLFLVIMVFSFFLPIIIDAESCDQSEISIKSITLSDTIGNAEEINNATANGKKINLDFKLYDPNDSLKYTIVVKNDSNEDYYFDGESLLLNTDYLHYEFTYDNNSNIIKAKEEKNIFLSVKYNNKVPESKLVNDSFNEINTMKINMTKLTNPKTGEINSILLIVSILIIGITVYFVIIKQNQILLVFFIAIVIIPISVKAICKYEIEIEAKVQIDGKEAFFLPGIETNIKMKQLAGNDTSTDAQNTFDENILAIKKSESEPLEINKEEKNIVSTSDSPYPIYMWYDNETLYWWSEDRTPSLNPVSSYFFVALKNASNMEGISNWDTSKVENMSFMFSDCESLTNLNALANWNTSNVKTLRAAFNGQSNLESLEGIKKWDVSNVTSLYYTFYDDVKLTSLNGLEDWDVSNVESLGDTFRNCKKLSDVSALKKWNTSKVKTLAYLFEACSELHSLNGLEDWNTSSVTSILLIFSSTDLTDISALRRWDVSKVTDMRFIFRNNYNLEDLSALSNWNTISATDFTSAFRELKKIKDLEAFRNWNVSNVETFGSMFSGDSALEDASAINDWNIQSGTSFTNMFSGCNVHPTFSKRSGTWDSSGTFSPQ